MNQPSDSPRRVRRAHGMSKAQVVQWALDRAAPDGDCLITHLRPGSNGYGQVGFGGRIRPLHRFVLEDKLGRDLTDREVAMHSCHRPLCINPAHLSAGSQADNIADKATNGRLRTKISEQQAATIRTRHAAGGITQAALAREYGVSPSYLGLVIRCKRP